MGDEPLPERRRDAGLLARIRQLNYVELLVLAVLIAIELGLCRG